MSLLSRLNKTPSPPPTLLETVLKTLHENGQLAAVLADVTSNRTLSSQQASALSDDPVTYLLSETVHTASPPAPMSNRRYLPKTAHRVSFSISADVRHRIRMRFLNELDTPTMGVTPEFLATWQHLLVSIITDEGLTLSEDEVDAISQDIQFELLGMGPLEWLLADPTVTDIFVMSYRDIRVRRNAAWHQVDGVSFEDEYHLYRIIDRACPATGPDPHAPVRANHLDDGTVVTCVFPNDGYLPPILILQKPIA